MSRETLRLLRTPAKPAVPRALLKQAVKLFRSPMIPRELRRANARKWLAANLVLADKHLYRGGSANWSHPQILAKVK